MKVLGLSCSPRKGGNTEILLETALESAQACGAETEFLSVRNKTLKPCDGCFYCVKHDRCRLDDDMQEFYDKILACDAMIWGTPVYFFDATAQAKIIIDRLFHFYMNMKLKNKVGGVIAVASSLGHYPVFNLFHTFFLINHMQVADFVYGFAALKKVIRKDRHAMAASAELGKQVVLLVERGFTYPEKYEYPLYRQVTADTGIHMSPAMNRFSARAKPYTKYH